MKNHKDKFISTDIVAWEGVITVYSAIIHHIKEGDDIRLANEKEIKVYKLVNKIK